MTSGGAAWLGAVQPNIRAPATSRPSLWQVTAAVQVP